MEITGWGRFPKADCRVVHPRSEAEVKHFVAGKGSAIARGNGRAYGDSALNTDLTLDMTRMDRLIDFDPSTGLLTVEAGVLLEDIIDGFLPRGWFPPVTPGTKFVTIGGMIAADVHGKNHHKHGSFGRFVAWLDLLCPDGHVRRCSGAANSELLAFTIGGMGLTGVILRAAFLMMKVETGWISQTLRPARNLDEAIAIFDESAHWTYSVAWIDCLAQGKSLGRSLVMLGEHAKPDELGAAQQADPFACKRRKRRNIPFDAPAFALNRFTVRAFNALYYRKGRYAAGESLVDWDSYFYPLDAILNWNRIYGRPGFTQFQCVLPLAQSKDGVAELLKTISRAGQGSFLAVLKRMGPQDSRFSFPMEGYTLALDFPATTECLDLIERLHALTLLYGGRIYLAKDATMKAQVLTEADKRTTLFRAMRSAIGADTRFASLQSKRLSL